MSFIEQITYQAPASGGGKISELTSTLRSPAARGRWFFDLEPWLQAGKPLSSAYLNFGRDAAFIRWYAKPGSQDDWDLAHVRVGDANTLTGRFALELEGPDRRALGPPQVRPPKISTDPARIEASVRSAEAAAQLARLLAHALTGEPRVTLYCEEPSLHEAIMWGLLSVLPMIGDNRPVSFITRMNAAVGNINVPGLFVSLRKDRAEGGPSPDHRYETLAHALATRFAADPDDLRGFLARHGFPGRAADPGRIGRLLELPEMQGRGIGAERPTVPRDANDQPGPVIPQAVVPQAVVPQAVVPQAVVPQAVAVPGRQAEGAKSGDVVMCPMCLHEIESWDSLGYWRWDPSDGEYVEIAIQPGLNKTQLGRARHGASVRCPSPQGKERLGAHYLPADYGRYGPPVVLGFVGLTKSGKSHLLASMVGAIAGRELAKFGISSNALDHSLHRKYLDTWVVPLRQGKVLPGTREGIVEFADAFLVKGAGDSERVVALFDVAGGELAKLDETKEFLWIADGLFFVVDADRINEPWSEDETFSSVLDVVRKRTRDETVSAAVVLNKGDLLRFDEPVDRWLRSGDDRSGRVLDPVEFLRESADIYAFLDGRNALAMAEPYEVCMKATLHVASPTGGAETGDGGEYRRGVTPRRVLRPLVAMLAMTGVLTDPAAEQVGV